MTSRERVLSAVDHQEPDRVPIDLGGTIMSGIMAVALHELRKYLKLEQKPVKVYEVFQMLGEVEMDLVEAFGIDILPVEPLVQFFGLRREKYKPWKLMDGTGVLVPGQFEVEVDSSGSWILHEEGDPGQAVAARMPEGGYYFDMISDSGGPVFTPPPLNEVEKENLISAEELDFMTARAERLRKETDKALVLGAWGCLGLPDVGTIPDFLCLLALEKEYVRNLFEIRTAVALQNLEKLKSWLGDSIDIIGLDGTDYGTQRNELFSPELFEELYFPFFTIQNRWVHENTNWKTWQHTCGSVTRIIPLLIESGLDILNPVQTSAAGMDPGRLKETFGKDICFWGGGIDTQKVLPFSPVEDVRKQVKERIGIFGPGGGFIFNPIHNVQYGTPPANIAAAFETALHEGGYPLI